MKRLLALAGLSLSLVLAPFASAQEDQYVRIFNLIVQADALRTDGKGRESLEKYLEAQDGLKKIQSAFPSWNVNVVNFRLKYITDRMAPLMQQFPGTAMPKPILPPGTMDPLIGRISGLEKALFDKDQQIISFRADKERAEAAMRDAEAKLREALSARPKDVDPVEMAKAQERVKLFQKDLDIQKITLEQQTAKLSGLAKEKDSLQKQIEDEKRENPMLKTQNEGLKKQVSELSKQVGALPKVQDLQAQLAAVKTELKATQVQNEALQKDNKKMETLLTDPDFATGDTSKVKELEKQRAALEAQLKEASKNTDKLKQLEKERDDLQKKLNDALKAGGEKKSKLADSAEVERLANQLAAARARVAALESKAVPYSKEELALFRQPRTPEPRAVALATSKSPSPSRGIPAEARPLLVEATTDFDQRRFAEAEAKFTKALAYDDKQLVTLGNIATTQLEQDKFPEAEATIRRALALAPDDPYTLSLLGLLRYRQNRIEESLDALSRAAQLDPRNAATQNQLGLALAQKSIRAPAEAAFRKAIQLQPNYGQAHYNLAVLYSTAQPPTMELARWHYQKALANGMSPNASLEKTLGTQPE